MMPHDRITPTRSSRPIWRSISSSVKFKSVLLFTSNPSRPAVVNHLHSESQNHDAKKNAELLAIGTCKQLRAQQRAAQNAKRYRHGQAGIDVAAMQVDARAGGSSHADHEV